MWSVLFAIELHLRPGDLLRVGLRPGAERLDGLPERVPEPGQLVLDARWYGRVLVRLTKPSRSRPRSVRVNIRWEMPLTRRLISLKRLAPSPSRTMMRMLHLSPTRARMARTA